MLKITTAEQTGRQRGVRWGPARSLGRPGLQGCQCQEKRHDTIFYTNEFNDLVEMYWFLERHKLQNLCKKEQVIYPALHQLQKFNSLKLLHNESARARILRWRILPNI